MIQLADILQAWGTDAFEPRLKAALEALGVDQLPLQQGLTSSSIALDDELRAVIMHIEAEADTIKVRAGIFYTGMISGCSCADDPTPVPRENEYCDVLLEIDRANGDTRITLLAD